MFQGEFLATAMPDELEQGLPWVRWTPKIAGEYAYHDLRLAVKNFEPRYCPAGEAGARWLKEESLKHHQTIETHLFYEEPMLRGFIAVTVAGNVVMSKLPSAPFGGRVPATELVWWCKRAGDQQAGRKLFLRAVALAKHKWGEDPRAILLVRPHDEETHIALLEDDKYVFWETPDGERLWTPLTPR
jgi:hypothetical protein